MNIEYLSNCTAGTDGTVSDSGWSNSSILKMYLQDHFMKYIQREAGEPILLLYDGHTSHVSLSVLQWARENNIIILILPAHTSHVIQPLDVGCFGPLQKVYNSECQKYMRANIGATISKFVIGEIGSKAYSKGLSPENLRSSFRKTGIYPFNRSEYDASKILPAQVLSDCNVEQDPSNNIELLEFVYM